MKKISGIYKITNVITNDFYIGSSKNVKKRWTAHKAPSRWNEHPNSQMYLDMQKFGVNSFIFEILAEAEIDRLKEKEQQFIETLKPTYNSCNANGRNIERQKKYEKTDKCKKYRKEYRNQLCFYNGQTLTLAALSMRFYKAGIEHPVIEAKKYLLV